MYRTLLEGMWLSGNVYSQITIFNEYKLLKTIGPHVASNVRYIAFSLSTNTLQRPAFLCFQGYILNLTKAAPTILISEDER